MDLIQAKDNKDEDNSSSRFRGIYMESPSVSDLFRSNAKNFGRAHYVMETPTENFNEASIIYGEKNIAESFRPTITSFPSPANFLDLPKRFGGLDYMYDTGASITALQETKVSEIQVNKAITTTAGASGENLALSKNVLNDPRFYKADLGSSKRPDSILVVDNDVFFIDADKKILGRVTPNGIEILTTGKTSKLFDKFFEDVTIANIKIDTRYSLGYNPRTQELLLTKYTNVPGLTGVDPFNTYGRIIPEGRYTRPTKKETTSLASMKTTLSTKETFGLGRHLQFPTALRVVTGRPSTLLGLKDMSTLTTPLCLFSQAMNRGTA